MQSEKSCKKLHGNIPSFGSVQMLERTVFLNTGVLFVGRHKVMKKSAIW